MSSDSPVARLREPLFSALRQMTGEPFSDWSLRLRLSVCFTLFLACAWVLIALFSWHENRKYINRFFDTQQMIFAKTLLAMEPGGQMAGFPPGIPKDGEILRGVLREARGSQDKNALGFAVFDGSGRRLLDDGERGRLFAFEGRTEGFVDAALERHPEPWRLVWLKSRDGTRVVAVGQELKYRDRMTMDMLNKQLLPWLLLLPVPLAGLFWLLNRELAPVRKATASLEARSPSDIRPLNAKEVPPEVRPLLRAMNSLFARMAAMLERERAFVADAAHELRTPLAGLRVQAEVFALTGSAEERDRAAGNMLGSIDRCGRLVEQLLTLSQLERIAGERKEGAAVRFARDAPLNWETLLREAVDAALPSAGRKNVSICMTAEVYPDNMRGNEHLIEIMLRNILDNAVKYCMDDGNIHISLDRRGLVVENDGKGVEPQYLPRIGERFFRPPGQEQGGCGLGFSIIRNIAEIHGFSVLLDNRYSMRDNRPDGFRVSVLFCRE